MSRRSIQFRRLTARAPVVPPTLRGSVETLADGVFEHLRLHGRVPHVSLGILKAGDFRGHTGEPPVRPKGGRQNPSTLMFSIEPRFAHVRERQEVSPLKRSAHAIKGRSQTRVELVEKALPHARPLNRYRVRRIPTSTPERRRCIDHSTSQRLVTSWSQCVGVRKFMRRESSGSRTEAQSV